MEDQSVTPAFPTETVLRDARALAPKKGVLHPYEPAEAICITEAAARAGKSDRTIRNWCMERQIGRRIAGQWAVSAVALDMLLAGDEDSLQSYLAGDRSSAPVVAYYRLRSIPIAWLAQVAAPSPVSDISGFADFAVAEAGNR